MASATANASAAASPYVSVAYGLSTPFPVLSGMSALTELVSEGISNLIAGPAGPPNVGARFANERRRKIHIRRAMGAAYTTFEDNSLHVAVGTPGLLYSGTANYMIGPITAGLIAADFNGDGVLDVAITFLGDNSPGGLAVLINNGDGTLKSPVMYAPGASPISLAALDLNKDGILDLAVADNASSSVYVLLGNGDGTFQSPAVTPGGGATQNPFLTVADFTGDGIPDAVVPGTGQNVLLFTGTKSGVFKAPTAVSAGQISPTGGASGDFNGDGKPDLAIAGSNSVGILLNTGAGFQTPSTFSSGGQGPTGIVAADFNRDGKLDLAVANSASRHDGRVPGRR